MAIQLFIFALISSAIWFICLHFLIRGAVKGAINDVYEQRKKERLERAQSVAASRHQTTKTETTLITKTGKRFERSPRPAID